METQIISHIIILFAGIALGMYITTQLSSWINKNSK